MRARTSSSEQPNSTETSRTVRGAGQSMSPPYAGALRVLRPEERDRKRLARAVVADPVSEREIVGRHVDPGQRPDRGERDEVGRVQHAREWLVRDEAVR